MHFVVVMYYFLTISISQTPADIRLVSFKYKDKGVESDPLKMSVSDLVNK